MDWRCKEVREIIYSQGGDDLRRCAVGVRAGTFVGAAAAEDTADALDERWLRLRLILVDYSAGIRQKEFLVVAQGVPFASFVSTADSNPTNGIPHL